MNHLDSGPQRGPCTYSCTLYLVPISLCIIADTITTSRGNLGRAGYGATTEGMWPYSYDSCDLGTFVSQQDQSGNPTVETQLGSDGTFSSLPGQKLSACTCPGEDHPGPSTGSGRGVPEVDMYVGISIRFAQLSLKMRLPTVLKHKSNLQLGKGRYPSLSRSHRSMRTTNLITRV